jgi:hypothetical protein
MSEQADEQDADVLAGATAEVYAGIQKSFEQQSKVLGEAFLLIYKAGLMNELSQRSRDYIADSEWIQEIIKMGEGPNLEPRLSAKEYIQHLSRILEVPSAQLEFLTFVVKTCYMMMLTEKNPMVAQELRGASSLTNTLDELMRS